MAKEKQYHDGQALKAVWWDNCAAGYKVCDNESFGAMSITVCMEAGPMSEIPWALVEFPPVKNKPSRKINLAFCVDVELF